jgi:hypothetical protein
VSEAAQGARAATLGCDPSEVAPSAGGRLQLQGGAQELLWGGGISAVQLGRLLRSSSAPQHGDNGGGGVVLAADVTRPPARPHTHTSMAN